MPNQTVELEPWEHQAIQDLMSQMQDSEQSLEDVRIEDEAGGNVGAGIPDHQLGKFLSDPAGFYEHQHLKRLVFTGLRQLLLECNLGAGQAAAYATGKQLLSERLQQPSAEIQQQLIALLTEALASPQSIPLSATAQASLRQVIQRVLSAEDWETISAAATHTLEQHIKAIVELPQTA